MNKAVEHDLLSLIPAIELPLPAELISLTISLLAQSRSKAANLKKDEEIARGYACANIACERFEDLPISTRVSECLDLIEYTNRLKQTLDLPAIVPKPPLPPRIYKKLYIHLDTTLAPRSQNQQEGTTSAPVTPNKARITSARATPNKPTPSKTRTPKPASAKRSFDNLSADGVPGWVMHAIRQLCKAFKKPSAAPHVFVGVSTILKLLQEQMNSPATQSRKRVRRSPGDTPNTKLFSFHDNQIPALIAVVAIYTLSVLSPQDFEGGEEYKKKKGLAIRTLLPLAPDESTTEDAISDDIELFLREAQNGWLDMEWYQNLTDQWRADDLTNEANDHGSVEEDEDEDEAREEADGEATRRSRKAAHGINENGNLSKRVGGGMMTPATDWLSDEKRREYMRWKAKFLVELERAEKGKSKLGI
jgi:origin recognition complex subunit 6